MSLKAGMRLGPYEIVAPLGAGGMGEVWKARDTRLDRSVAIKVLPPALANDTHFRARFDREAKTISQLSHPHICALYDIGDENGVSFLVMELVEGESLADRIGRGPLPLAEVVLYGAQIAEALDRAHRAGIVHRDLKPGNVMVTRAGVKLLDFGLAKTASTAPVSSSPHESTMVHQEPLTAEGMVVGTVQYMAPEQLSGDNVDARSDIFALGAVLYEMATGKRAFTGSNRTSLIASIMGSEPRPLSELQPLTPAAFEHVVASCLVKDPERRWQSARDVAEELRWIASGGTGTSGPFVPTLPRSPMRAAVPWLIAIAAIALAGAAWWRGRTSPPIRVTKTIVSRELESAWNMSPAISPDGRLIAYPAGGALWIRGLDDLEPRKVPITGVHQPVLFWSPDSKWVAFVSDGKLWKIASGGNTPVMIAPLSQIGHEFHSGAWGADDRIVLAAFMGGIYEMPARGGVPVEIVRLTPDLVDFHNLSFFPDGKTILAVPHALSNMMGIEAIQGTNRQMIATFDATVRDVVYSRTGHLLVSLRGLDAGVWGVPFSLETMKVSGKRFLVAAGAGACSVSSDGSLTYVSNIDYAPKQIVRIDQTGKLSGNVGEPIPSADDLTLSPDERSLAISARESDNNASIEIVDLTTGSRRRLTQGFLEDHPSRWTADGQQLVATRSPTLNWSDPRFGVWLLRVDGSGEHRKVATGWRGTLSSDGRSIIYLRGLRPVDSGIFIVPLSGGEPVPLVKSVQSNPRSLLLPSPDGRFLLYNSSLTQEDELYLTRYPSGEGRWQVSRDTAIPAAWSRDGRTIYFASRNRMMTASLTESPSVAVGDARVVFDATPLNVRLERSFQVLADGSFMAVQDLPDDKREVVLVQNWFSEFSDEAK